MTGIPVFVEQRQLAVTIQHLHEAGRQNHECVVLWCGERSDTAIRVREVYRPQQIAQEDYFSIPPDGMKKVMTLLRQHNWMIAAQVHSHPQEAFHSAADDRWAIVRHKGAISIVVPYFAEGATVDNFLGKSACFVLTRNNHWSLVSYPSSGKSVWVTT